MRLTLPKRIRRALLRQTCDQSTNCPRPFSRSKESQPAMPPSVSVIIPVYNRFELLKHSVESVLTQTWPVFEVILVDDGSYDGTSEMLQKYVAQNERWQERVRYFHQENQGAGAARNIGVAKATGEWLAFNDNDDLWLPQKLEWQFRAIDKFQGQCGLCFTDAWFMNN